MIALFAIALSLTSTNDYLWTTGAAPYEVIGIGTGPSLDYSLLRGEDVSFLFECFYERNDVVKALGMEDDSADLPFASRRPFPSAIPNYDDRDEHHTTAWLYICDAGFSFANYLMTTNGTPCNSVFDRSKTISGMKRIERPAMSGLFISSEELTNIYTSGRANFIPRHVNYTYGLRHYGPTNDVYSIRPISSVITNLYLDFGSTDALQFSGKRARASGGGIYHSFGETRHVNYAVAYGDMGWGFAEDVTDRNDTTNSSPFSLLSPSYSVMFYGHKQTASAYDGQSLEGTEKGYELVSSEEWRNPLGTCLVEFHHSLSNLIDDVDLFCLFRVTHDKYWPKDGTTGANTNVYSSCWVIARLDDVREIERKENGARRFSFNINMPETAHRIIEFVGETYPEEGVLNVLSYPEPLGPIHDAVHVYLRRAHTSYSSDSLTVSAREVIGVAKLDWRTKVLKQQPK